MSGSGYSLLEALSARASSMPTKRVFTFLNKSGMENDRLTYAELDARATCLARHLLAPGGMRAGDRALLVYPPSLDFLVSFLACLRAGVIAVPVFPPNPERLNKDLDMFASIQRSSGALVALTSKVYQWGTKVATAKERLLSKGDVKWPDLKWVVTDDLYVTEVVVEGEELVILPVAPGFNSDKLAFLQFTSGSTSEPKGVMITHANLAHNLDLIVTGLSASEDTVVVSWLPQYHDMGLIGSYLGIIYCGGSGYYMEPYAFIRNPTMWVEAISKYRGTHMQAPSFAYGLTARKYLALRKKPSLDLSSIRHMINAAEPVEVLGIDEFYAAFESCGLPRGVIFPTYGLAEHTVYVCSNGTQRIVVDKLALERERKVELLDEQAMSDWTVGAHYRDGGGDEGDDDDEEDEHDGFRRRRDAPQPITVVGCGVPGETAGLSLRIVHSEDDSSDGGKAGEAPGKPLGEDRVGEIWVKSASRARGYWSLEEQSRRDFGGRVENEEDGEGYLRTGDLGFMHQGQLFVCGRKKDLIIVRGRNHYPQDLERSAEGAVPGALRGGCSAAFAVKLESVGEEMVALVAEVKDPKEHANEAVTDAIRSTVSGAHGVNLCAVILLKPRTIEKTTSGKIARQRCKEGFLQSTLEAVYEWHSDAQRAREELNDEDAADDDGTVEKVDVAAMSDDDLLAALMKEVATCINCEPSDLTVDAPLMDLGLDSMAGNELLTYLDRSFACSVPQDLVFQKETTLKSLVGIVRAGGIRDRAASMVDCAEMARLDRAAGIGEANKMPTHIKNARVKRRGKCSVKTGFGTREVEGRSDLFFEAGALGRPAGGAAASPSDGTALWKMLYRRLTLQVVIVSLAVAFADARCGAAAVAFLAVPLLVFNAMNAKADLPSPSCALPATVFSSPWRERVLRQNAFRWLFFTPLDPGSVYLMASCSVSAKPQKERADAPSWPSLAHICAALACPGVFGFALNTMPARESPSALRALLSFPYHARNLLGASAGYSKQALLNMLGRGQSVLLSLNEDAGRCSTTADGTRSITVKGVRSSKDFIRAAMSAGVELVPCLEFESSDGATSLICGSPLEAFPKTANPSMELVADRHAAYIASIQGLYLRHCLAMGLDGTLKIR